MFHEGIYSLTFKGHFEPGVSDVAEGGDGEALAILRNGKILGSDRWGGVFSGTYEFDAVAGHEKVHVRIDVPPEGELITGFAAGAQGATFDIVAAFKSAARRASTTVEIAGQFIDVEFSFLGPLPN